MAVRGHGRTRWLSLIVLALIAGGAVLVRAPSLSAGSKDSAVAYTGPRVDVSAAATVNVRVLARIDRLRRHVVVRPAWPENPGPQVKPESVAEEAAEAEEKAEPNLAVTMPSPLVYPLSVGTSAPAEPSPFPSASFLGQADVPQIGMTTTESPPDTDGAVGREKLMVALNNNYVVQRKSDGVALSRMAITTFWGALGVHNPFDPRVLYDPYSDRWLATAADDPLLGSSKILYGISDTGDPEGRWHLYAIDSDTTDATWADFPTVGFSRSTVAIGVNMFVIGGLTYVRGRLIVLDYASLQAGGDGNPVDVSVPSGFALQPAITHSPTEQTLYVVEHVESVTGTYRLWSLSDRTLTLVGGAPKTNPLGPWGTAGPGNILPQEYGPGVDSGDSRVGNAVFRNGRIYYAQTIGMPPGPGAGNVIHTAVQWVELDTSGNFVQGGRIEDPGANPWNGGKSYAFASLAANARNDVLVGFSEFESDDFVDAGYAFRAGTDPPNTLRAPVTLKEGDGQYEKRRGGRNRWGDYSSTIVDPSDDLSLWTLQEYARAPSGRGDHSGRWGVWWGRVGGGPAVVTRQCVVPSANGKTLAQARRLLASGQCRLGSVRHAKSAAKTKNRVVRQRPRPGTTLDANARVNLWLGKGSTRTRLG